MITATQQPLTEDRELKIRTLLKSPACHDLASVVEAKQKTFEAKMTGPATESAEYPNKIAEANESLRSAARYATFLSVLKELQDQPQQFTLVKLD